MRDLHGSRMRSTIALLHELDPVLGGHVPPWLVDELVEGYFSWQDESTAVESAYERWRAMPRADRALAFAAYRAALDREEHAARVFRASADRVFGPGD
jgi:hypothetical protein